MGCGPNYIFGEIMHPLLELDLVFTEVEGEFTHHLSYSLGFRCDYPTGVLSPFITAVSYLEVT